MGGGTNRFWAVCFPTNGLSPRGRGNLRSLGPANVHRGSIPAWAGEPCKQPARQRIPKVYPRVGGGTNIHPKTMPAESGLSPRGRGNHLHADRDRQLQRSIPAWAGEPTPSTSPKTFPKVYPRVGGGTRLVTSACNSSAGLSPRGRGNPDLHGPLFPFTEVYPRVGGGTVDQGLYQSDAEGLSPRGRGNRRRRLSPGRRNRSIPAWAGEPTPCHPRAPPSRGLSPRGRGNHGLGQYRPSKGGSIPAWAGEPTTPSSNATLRTVYPRVGGGTSTVRARISLMSGLSPRGRGNPATVWNVP